MVRLANLDGDYYVFDEEHYELVGAGRERNSKLGQTVKIQVVSVDRYLKTIDFLPVRNFRQTIARFRFCSGQTL